MLCHRLSGRFVSAGLDQQTDFTKTIDTSVWQEPVVISIQLQGLLSVVQGGHRHQELPSLCVLDHLCLTMAP